jgi:hypothetical protein
MGDYSQVKFKMLFTALVAEAQQNSPIRIGSDIFAKQGLLGAK